MLVMRIHQVDRQKPAWFYSDTYSGYFAAPTNELTYCAFLTLFNLYSAFQVH